MGGRAVSGHTGHPGPWTFTLRCEWPWGWEITSSNGVVFATDGIAHSTCQRTRLHYENAVGFAYKDVAVIEQRVKEHDNLGRLIADAPDFYDACRIIASYTGKDEAAMYAAGLAAQAIAKAGL